MLLYVFWQGLIVRQSCWFNGAPGVLARHEAAKSSARLHLAANPFRFAKNAQHVPAKNLANVVSAVAAVEQGLRNLWQVSGRVDALRSRPADAIKVRSQPYMINASHFGNMVDV